MKQPACWAALGLLTGVLCLPVAATEDGGFAGWDDGFRFESADGAHALEISNRVQVRFTQEDPDFGEDKGSFRVARYKLKFEGHVYEHWSFKLQANLAGGSIAGENERLLEDAWLEYTRQRWARPGVGQAKAWFGRQELTSSGKQQFVDRSIASRRFAASRQIGASLTGWNEEHTFEYDVGLYNGESINETENLDDEFMTVARVVFMPFGQLELEESSLDRPENPKLAVGAAALMNSVPRSLTPPVGGPLTVDEGVDRYGAEVAFKLRGFNAVGEYYAETTELASVAAGGGIMIQDVDTDGYYAQAGWLFPNDIEIAARVSEISPDVQGPSADETESGIAVSYYVERHDYKVQADYRKLSDDGDPAADSNELRVQLQLSF